MTVTRTQDFYRGWSNLSSCALFAQETLQWPPMGNQLMVYTHFGYVVKTSIRNYFAKSRRRIACLDSV